MKFKRLLALTLSATMLFSSLTVSAATSEEAVLPGTDTAQSSETLVTGKQGSTFLVRIPKTMNITINADGNMTDSYNVTVKGDISGTETVKVVPDTLFNLVADEKAAINTAVTQAKTSFKYDEIVTENVQVGGIAASGLTAGTWSGQFNFNISIENIYSNGLSIDGNILVGTGEQTQAIVFYNGKPANDKVDFLSNNPNIIVDEDGNISTKASVSIGEKATITASLNQIASTKSIIFSNLIPRELASEKPEIDFTVTIVDIEYSVSSVSLKPGESTEVTAKILPDTIAEKITFTRTSVGGINLTKNGNSVKISIADDMETGKTHQLIATIGDYSKALDINIIADHIHTYIETIIPPTTSEKGYTLYMCNDCGHEFKDNYVDIIAIVAGLYDENEKITRTWDSLIADGTLKVSNGILTSGFNQSSWTNSSSNTLTGKLIISNDVKTIGKNAFHWCDNLKSVIIPDTVTLIEDNSFEKCLGLTSIAIPDSVISVGYAAFSSCISLETVKIEGNPQMVSGSIFMGCTKLSSVMFSKDITAIAPYSFRNCTSLKSISIPNSVTEIGHGAFMGCSNLESVTIPTGMTIIKNTVFQDCAKLTSVTIPNNITSIENNAFKGCISLMSIKIPNSVITIGTAAFYNVPQIQYAGTATGAPWGAKKITK